MGRHPLDHYFLAVPGGLTRSARPAPDPRIVPPDSAAIGPVRRGLTQRPSGYAGRPLLDATGMESAEPGHRLAGPDTLDGGGRRLGVSRCAQEPVSRRGGERADIRN